MKYGGYKQDFSKSLKELRDCYNLTQTEIAGWLGVAPSTVMRWEAQKTYPRREHYLLMTWIADVVKNYPRIYWDKRISEIKAERKIK